MIRYLDARNYRLDDLLREEFSPGKPLGRGPQATGDDWGVPGALALEILSGEERVAAGGGVWRPSHASLFGYDSETGVQANQDAFAADDGTLVCVVSLRNAGGFAADVSVRSRWLSESDVRIAPPGDDSVRTLDPAGRMQLVWTFGGARELAEVWAGERDPVRRQADRLDAWLTASFPLFDATDTALMMGFYRELYDAWRAGERSGETATLARLLAPKFEGETLTLTPNVGGLTGFCLADWQVGDSKLTVVWDDPARPGDLYDDGLKGFTVWRGTVRVHQSDAPGTVTLEV